MTCVTCALLPQPPTFFQWPHFSAKVPGCMQVRRACPKAPVCSLLPKAASLVIDGSEGTTLEGGKGRGGGEEEVGHTRLFFLGGVEWCVCLPRLPAPTPIGTPFGKARAGKTPRKAGGECACPRPPPPHLRLSSMPAAQQEEEKHKKEEQGLVWYHCFVSLFDSFIASLKRPCFHPRPHAMISLVIRWSWGYHSLTIPSCRVRARMQFNSVMVGGGLAYGKPKKRVLWGLRVGGEERVGTVMAYCLTVQVVAPPPPLSL